MVSLIADIGGTNTRCAIADGAGSHESTLVFKNRDFTGLAELLKSYLDSLPADQRPRSSVLAIAAPIRGEDVRMINIDWQYSVTDLKRELGFDDLRILNDWEALAIALPALSDAQLTRVGDGEQQAGKPKVAIGPGTGLGVASLIPVDGGWKAVSGEGGHVTLAASNDDEARVIARVRDDYGHCSAERLISGPGMSYLHRLLHETGDQLTPKRIAELADAGDRAARQTLEMFFRLFGTVAANLALTIGAFGGVYIGGGVIRRNTEQFAKSGFRERFEAKGRYGNYLKSIPTYVIDADEPALIGLAEFARDLADNA